MLKFPEINRSSDSKSIYQEEKKSRKATGSGSSSQPDIIEDSSTELETSIKGISNEIYEAPTPRGLRASIRESLHGAMSTIADTIMGDRDIERNSSYVYEESTLDTTMMPFSGGQKAQGDILLGGAGEELTAEQRREISNLGTRDKNKEFVKKLIEVHIHLEILYCFKNSTMKLI